MKNLRKLVSLLMCVCMLLGMTAMAEEAVETVETIPAETVVATLNGKDITWGDLEKNYNGFVAQYGAYYDDAFLRAVTLENYITECLLMEKAVEFGVSELSAEESAAIAASAAEELEAGIASYISYFYADLTEESSEEDKAAARAEAEKYYADAGYDLETLTADMQRYAVITKVEDLMLQDVTVTDEEVEALYQSLVAADKELYENDIAAYVDYNSQVDMMAMYAQMYGSAGNMDHAWYKPEGFRGVKHILLSVDETLMNTYTDLQARYEEQQNSAEETAEEAETSEEAAEPVTAEQINAAKAAILASVADKIEEINTKLAQGADFDALIAEYGSDPGMNSEPYKTTGYEVCAASSNYVPEFVEASMSISEVGGVSAPYLSDFGVHIVKYIGDIAGGPVEMTEAQREAKRAELLNTKQNELYMATIESWTSECEISYTGAVPTLEELEALEAAAAEAAAE